MKHRRIILPLGENLYPLISEFNRGLTNKLFFEFYYGLYFEIFKELKIMIEYGSQNET